jgi:hypothetical protein
MSELQITAAAGVSEELRVAPQESLREIAETVGEIPHPESNRTNDVVNVA